MSTNLNRKSRRYIEYNIPIHVSIALVIVMKVSDEG